MDIEIVRQLQIAPLDGYDPEIGRWLWALQDVRRRYTLRLVPDLDPRLVDWEGPDGQENAIGSLLYHIAKVELGWLYGDLKGLTDLTPAVKPDFPFPSTESDRTHLTRVLHPAGRACCPARARSRRLPSGIPRDLVRRVAPPAPTA